MKQKQEFFLIFCCWLVLVLSPDDGDNISGPPSGGEEEDGVIPFLGPSPADDDDSCNFANLHRLVTEGS